MSVGNLGRREQARQKTIRSYGLLRQVLDGQRTCDPDTLARHVAQVWIGSWPQDNLTNDQWRNLFQAIGYRSEGRPAIPPVEVRLYRGAPPERRDRWSWTTEPRYAINFAKLHKHGRIWTADVPGSALLAHLPASHLYVVDTDGLDIRPL